MAKDMYGWRQIQAPNFSASNQLYQSSAKMFTEGLGQVADAPEKIASKDLTKRLQAAQVSKAESDVLTAQDELERSGLKDQLIAAQIDASKAQTESLGVEAVSRNLQNQVAALDLRLKSQAVKDAEKNLIKRENIEQLTNGFYDNMYKFSDATSISQWVGKQGRKAGLKGQEISALDQQLQQQFTATQTATTAYMDTAMKQDADLLTNQFALQTREMEDTINQKLRNAKVDPLLMKAYASSSTKSLIEYEKHATDVLGLDQASLSEIHRAYEKATGKTIQDATTLSVLVNLASERNWIFGSDTGIDSSDMRDAIKKVEHAKSPETVSLFNSTEDMRKNLLLKQQEEKNALTKYQLGERLRGTKSYYKGDPRVEYTSMF